MPFLNGGVFVQNYYEKLENIIEERETVKAVRELKDNREDLLSKWNIGKLLIEAQGGESRAKYGNGLIKEWGKKLSLKYGTNYSERNLELYRKLYTAFPISNALRSKLNWTHYRKIISIKNENERNYYINQVILNNLSSRDLEKIIKDKSFERLSYADKNNVKLIDGDNYTLTIEDIIKDPIIINSIDDNLSEKKLHKYIIDMIEDRFLELGMGFALMGHEYKIIIDNKTYKIDLLFFNVKINSYVVVEIKTKELHPKDIGQLEFYVNYINKNIKGKNHNKTIGLLIVKKNNKYVLEYITNKDVFVTTFKLLKENWNNKKYL